MPFSFSIEQLFSVEEQLKGAQYLLTGLLGEINKKPAFIMLDEKDDKWHVLQD